MRKALIMSLMAITPLIAIPTQPTSETVKLALAGAGQVACVANLIYKKPNIQSLPLLGLLAGSSWVLDSLARSKSLLIKGTSNVLIGYSVLALLSTDWMQKAYSHDRTLYALATLGYAAIAAWGTKDIIEGIAEQYESQPQQVLEQPIKQLQPIDYDIIIAVKQGDIEQVAELLKSGADINAHDAHGSTLLHLAVIKDDVDLVQLLITFGSCLDLKNVEDLTPLQTAILNSSWNSIALLIQAGADASGMLSWAAEIGDTQLIEVLLKNGCSVDEINPEFSYTSLHLAAKYGKTATVKLLIAHGADTTLLYDEYEEGNLTAYDLAVKYGHTEIAQLLADHTTKLKK